MESQPNGYVSELKNELNEMLEVVVLPEMTTTDEQCIYKIPQEIRKLNPRAYTPRIVSIGPFHSPRGSSISNNNNLHQMEELKLKYLKGFLNRTTNLSMDDLVFKVQKLENKIRNCNAGLGSFDSKDFLKIIIVDACFIIEHFLRYFDFSIWEKEDPILSKTLLFVDIQQHDLALLENQLPFFVLEEIYKLANINLKLPSFIEITLDYFERFNLQNLSSETLCPKHFTYLLRTFLLPSSFDFAHGEVEYVEYETQHVYTVSQLSEAGLKIELSESKCLLDLEFDKGVLKMPCFHVHDVSKTHMKNIIAFEECHRRM